MVNATRIHCNIGACAGPYVTAAGILQPVYGFGSFPVYCDLYRDRDKKYWKLCNDPYLKENNITGCSVILILRKANILKSLSALDPYFTGLRI